MEIIKYKEFEGSAEIDLERLVCRGKILHIDDLVTYESKSIDSLKKEFEAAVEDYIETCKQIGKEPQKPCRGQFNVRVSPELHREAVRRAIEDDTSLNEVVCRALEDFLKSPPNKEQQTTPSISTAVPEIFFMTELTNELIQKAVGDMRLTTLGTATQTVEVCNVARIESSDTSRSNLIPFNLKRATQRLQNQNKPTGQKEKSRAH